MNQPTAPAFEPPASALLRGGAEAASDPGPPLRDLLALLEARGIGLGLLILGLLLLVPLRWGYPQVLGLGVAILGWRLCYGPHTLPMPKGLAQRPVPKSRLENYAGMAATIEGFVRPRLLDYSTGLGERAAGVAVLLLGVCVILPFAHFWAAVALMLIGVGLIQRDGLLVLPGFFVAVGVIAYMGAMLIGLPLGAEFAIGWAREQGEWMAPLIPKATPATP